MLLDCFLSQSLPMLRHQNQAESELKCFTYPTYIWIQDMRLHPRRTVLQACAADTRQASPLLSCSRHLCMELTSKFSAYSCYVLFELTNFRCDTPYYLGLSALQ